MKDGSEGKARRLLEEEKQAFERVQDLVEKYRILIPYVSARSESLEEKIEKLLENREEQEAIAARIQSSITEAKNRVAAFTKKEAEIEVKQARFAELYNRMLKGRIPAPEEGHLESVSLEGLKRAKEKFMHRVDDAFREIEGHMEAMDRKREKLQNRKDAAMEKVAELETRLTQVEKKIKLYKEDIRGRLEEFNEHLRRERDVKKRYVTLIRSLKKAPDFSEEAEREFKEALEKSRPHLQVLELGSPVSGNAR